MVTGIHWRPQRPPRSQRGKAATQSDNGAALKHKILNPRRKINRERRLFQGEVVPRAESPLFDTDYTDYHRFRRFLFYLRHLR
jgi:hypothetical protein